MEIEQLIVGLILTRKHDNKHFYISTHHKDGTYIIRQYSNNRIYGKFTKEQLDNIFIVGVY